MATIPNQVSFTTPNQNDPTGGQTLDALMARQKALMQQAAQPAPMQIASPFMGAANMVDKLSNVLQQNAVVSQERAGRQALAKAMSDTDPTTGMPKPENMAAVATIDPEFYQKLYEHSMTLKERQAETAAANAEWERRNAIEQGQKVTWADVPGQPGIQKSSTGEVRAVPMPDETWSPDPNNPNFLVSSRGNRKQVEGTAKLSDIGSMADDYTKAATLYNLSAPSFQSMKEAANTALNPKLDVKGKGAADYNMIVAYAKLLDPNSVVREGEVKSAALTGGQLDQINGWLNFISGQGSLSDDVRRGIMTEANSRMKAYYDQVKTNRDWTIEKARRHNIDERDVVQPLGEFQPFTEQKYDDPSKMSDADLDAAIKAAQGGKK